MKIAILGGAFNPPHLGHQLIAQQVLDFTPMETVWLTPCWRHTFDKTLALAKDRAAITKTLVNKHIKYCGDEIDNQLSGNTIELMELLDKKYPQHQFSFIIGSDNLKQFHQWGDWKKLITCWNFWVFPRPRFGFNLAKYDLAKPEYRFKLIRHPLLIHSNISSTNIRKRIKQNLNITGLVPHKVKQYIKMHQLYYEKRDR
ncbi:nicotinate (nicotinamide) nucleotide adenylyltransferase [Patescibacteria group bacterium]|nr:nicotinate (nicotinamide) nucleotide adenylyltransferase [Patescibacteria group bacterium]MBU1931805.1 nicotinate (nicotinamide) nucleotide adenylyltransferase [Patescibacteria group bacterium]